LKTADQYFYGANNSIQLAGVQYVFDSVIPALEQSPDRKFVEVEIAFFARWWAEQSSSMHARVTRLVQSGQLEFILGGWVMHDEAAAHYVDAIDQQTLGQQWIVQTFGVQPTVAWQIDPFGHSSTHASLFSLMGLDALFFARLDYQDKTYRTDAKTLQTLWRGSQSLGPATDLFTEALWHHYDA
jgi:alpha-mannosidase